MHQLLLNPVLVPQWHHKNLISFLEHTGLMVLLENLCILPALLIFTTIFLQVIHMADERLSAACLWNHHLARKIEINARSERRRM